MTLTQIEIFTHLAIEKSFSVVANKLGVSQPAISNSIKKMESELNTTLISRMQKEFVLTEEGTTILRYCEEIMTQVHNIYQECTINPNEQKISLTMGAVVSVNNKLLPRFINYYKRKNPFVKLTVLEGTDLEVETWLDDNLVDFGIFSWTNEKFEQEVLIEDHFYLVVSKKNKLSLAKKVKLQDFCTQPLILSEAGCGPLVRDLFKSNNLDVEVNYHVRELMTILALVKENVGISIVPELAIPEGYTDLKFIPIELDSKYNRKLYFSFKNDSKKKESIDNFKKFIVSFLSN